MELFSVMAMLLTPNTDPDDVAALKHESAEYVRATSFAGPPASQSDSPYWHAEHAEYMGADDAEYATY